MEAILKREQKLEANEMLNFFKSLNTEEQKSFKVFIDGFRLAKSMEKGKEVN